MLAVLSVMRGMKQGMNLKSSWCSGPGVLGNLVLGEKVTGDTVWHQMDFSSSISQKKNNGSKNGSQVEVLKS